MPHPRFLVPSQFVSSSALPLLPPTDWPISKNRDYSAFVCTGNQYGKQKYDGKYIMVEHSTNKTKKEKK